MPGKVSPRDPSRRVRCERRYRDGLVTDARMHPHIRNSRCPFLTILFLKNNHNLCCLDLRVSIRSPSVANTFSCLNIHCVFSTKQRVAVLSPDIRERLWPYIGGIAKQNGILPKCVGGVADHVHLLIALPTTMTVARAVQLIKAGSSGWIHQTFPTLRNFG